MEVFKNKYLSIKVDETKKVLIEEWYPTTKEMTNDEWKATRYKFKDIFLQYNLSKFLSLCKELYFLITPELQEWMAENITKGSEDLVEKAALVIPTELFAEVSLEQTMDEMETGKLDTAFFDNEQNARNWLNI